MWQLQANCNETNTELFFSKLESKVAKAKALCGSCAVADKCLQFALDTQIEFGIFVESPQTKGKPLFQTNLIVNFSNGESKTYLDVHPDQPMFIEKGTLTLETLDGSMIWYIPAVSIIDYYTECVRVS